MGKVGAYAQYVVTDARSVVRAPSIASLQTLVDRYEGGELDIAAVGRAALANPDFVNKIRAGSHDKLIPYSQHQHKLTLC